MYTCLTIAGVIIALVIGLYVWMLVVRLRAFTQLERSGLKLWQPTAARRWPAVLESHRAELAPLLGEIAHLKQLRFAQFGDCDVCFFSVPLEALPSPIFAPFGFDAFLVHWRRSGGPLEFGVTLLTRVGSAQAQQNIAMSRVFQEGLAHFGREQPVPAGLADWLYAVRMALPVALERAVGKDALALLAQGKDANIGRVHIAEHTLLLFARRLHDHAAAQCAYLRTVIAATNRGTPFLHGVA
jgi:hypothetical protein